ncbi:Alpha/Beta hydrolase protein [Pyronema domesticum]|uniref:Carboxylic ester hydrolase n=1 Tax=Pyronema omphalodes (strain CBS 100304) TaxID=1076935 RepID=U4LVB8_PYROM|nr:Alpha/Beta hydrolase protein [Pyronema domesticum]CCX32396.1 Similar to Lipase 3; acc. no. Q96VC9 [Pyronema omphalodes CBS 100304]
MATPEVFSDLLQTTFKGVQTADGVFQFRNIKYASVPKRFARSELVKSYEGQVVDATEHGPHPPGRIVPPGGDAEIALFAIPEAKRYPVQPIHDEFDCLNLSITIPATQTELLPVLINIPGGANTRCINGISLFDYTRLVSDSIAQKKPIIAIHVPYRVGLFGYGLLPNGKGGGNNGLFDQRNAFEWVKRHIKAFGGDPANITVAGESAGAFSVDCHLQSNDSVPYFRRAVLQSGTLRVLRPSSVEKRVELTRRAAAALGFDGEDWPERLAAASVEDIRQAQDKIGMFSISAVDDGEFFQKGIDVGKPIVPEWVDSIMIGDCGYEGFLWLPKFKHIEASKIIAVLESQGELGKAVLTAYPGLTSSDREVSLDATLYLLQDLSFSHPNSALTAAYKALDKPVYSYLFDQHNPWEPKKHRSHHACDLLFWFNGYDFSSTVDAKGNQDVSEAMKRALISYTNGENPWDDSEVMGFGPDGFVGTVAKENEGKTRRVHVYEILDKYPAEEVLKLSDVILAV